MQRTVLGLLALIATLLLAGCIGGVPTGDDPTSDVPTSDRESTALPEQCTGDETAPGFELPDGPLPERDGGFELTVNDSTVDRGEPVAFALMNVDDERRYTGTHAKYLLQHRTDDGWETVTLLREPYLGFNATAISHEPGEGFEWSFRVDAAGFTAGKYVVCERLSAGKYRFVYAGDSPVAVRFELLA